MDPVNIPAKYEVCSFTRFWDKRAYWTNYVMTSPLTSRRLHQLSVWIVWTHYALDDFVKIWSNSDKNCGRYSMLKVVMSRLWPHRVTWRHHVICPVRPFISETRKATNFIFGRYIHRVHANKMPLKIWEKRVRGRTQGLPKFFQYPLLSQELVKLRSSYLARIFTCLLYTSPSPRD